MWLEADTDDTDRYGRFYGMCGWPTVPTLIWTWWSRVSATRCCTTPNDRHWDEFSAVADAARAESVGLWGACESFGAPPVADASRPEPAPAAAAATPEAGIAPVLGGDCDPSYPGVCIPSAPPDLNCDDISARRFEVVGADPHGFDGNDDGAGCEN